MKGKVSEQDVKFPRVWEMDEPSPGDAVHELVGCRLRHGHLGERNHVQRALGLDGTRLHRAGESGAGRHVADRAGQTTEHGLKESCVERLGLMSYLRFLREATFDSGGAGNATGNQPGLQSASCQMRSDAKLRLSLPLPRQDGLDLRRVNSPQDQSLVELVHAAKEREELQSRLVAMNHVSVLLPAHPGSFELGGYESESLSRFYKWRNARIR